VRMIANHGSRKKYVNEIVGVNSRLDTLQAAILRVKLRRLDEYIERRRKAAGWYNEALSILADVEVPDRGPHDHVFHQYTIRVRSGRRQRDGLAKHLRADGIPSAIYYPIPLHRLPVFDDAHAHLPEADRAADEVLSLPMHTELQEGDIDWIASSVKAFLTR
jgi:UDP-2-acetamido-2-deoxy-ribo-hexuluronate aminotransferase